MNKSFACRLAVLGAAMVMGSIAGQPQKRMSSPSSMIMQVKKNAKFPPQCLLCRLLASFIPGRLRKPLRQPPTQHGHRRPGEVHQHRRCRPQIHVLKPMQRILMLKHQSRLFLANKSNSIIITPPRSLLRLS